MASVAHDDFWNDSLAHQQSEERSERRGRGRRGLAGLARTNMAEAPGNIPHDPHAPTELQVVTELPPFPYYERVLVFVGGFLAYASLIADVVAAAHYERNDDEWWKSLTFAFAFLPSVAMCIVMNFTLYKQPASREDLPFQLKVGEKPPAMTRRPQALVWFLITLAQFRLFFEAILSYNWGFQTGAYRDMRILHVIFQNVPQAVLQSYILFRQWNENVDFNFTFTIISLSLSMFMICLVPTSSPCFEDPTRLLEQQRQLQYKALKETARLSSNPEKTLKKSRSFNTLMGGKKKKKGLASCQHCELPITVAAIERQPRYW
jgi:XK-related protein